MSMLPTCCCVGRSGVFRVVGDRSSGQLNAARIVSQASAMARAYFQVWSIRSRTCRAPRVMWAATCSTRFLKVAISAWASSGVPVKPRILAQHQIDGREEGFQPRDVFIPSAAGKITQAGRCAFTDAVFDTGVPQSPTSSLAAPGSAIVTGMTEPDARAMIGRAHRALRGLIIGDRGVVV
jgi:hypothetical protein